VVRLVVVATESAVVQIGSSTFLARIFHTPIEQKGGGSVGKLVNIERYANTRHRPFRDRL